MLTTRTIFLMLLLAAVILMVLMSFLLLRQGEREEELGETTNTQQEVVPQPSEDKVSEVIVPVSQNQKETELLGTDLNMEFPTLEE